MITIISAAVSRQRRQTFGGFNGKGTSQIKFIMNESHPNVIIQLGIDIVLRGEAVRSLGNDKGQHVIGIGRLHRLKPYFI